MAEEGPVGAAAQPAQQAMLCDRRPGAQLAAELGLSVVSRSRTFQGKAADEQEWDALDVG